LSVEPGKTETLVRPALEGTVARRQLSLALSAPQLGWQRLGQRTSDALWPWAERLQPAIVWLRAAGYLVQAGSGGGSVRPPGDPAGRGSFSAMTLLGLPMAGRSRVKPQQITSYQ
jgi:hypothetical protein